MSKYTEESLNKMLKKDLIPNVLNLQSKIAENNINSNELLEETRMFNDIFSKLHSELALIRKVNTELTKRIVTLEVVGITLQSGGQQVGNKGTFNF